jgi:hypothetical protein
MQSQKLRYIKTPSLGFFYIPKYLSFMRIIITEEQKKKLFIPRKIEGEGSRWEQWNKEQPIVDGIRVNQYDSDGREQGIWVFYWDNGIIKLKGSYKNGLKHGIWQYYFSNGKPLYKIYY